MDWESNSCGKVRKPALRLVVPRFACMGKLSRISSHSACGVRHNIAGVPCGREGIKIEEVESKFVGDIDLHGFLGLDKSVRNGFQNIRMTLAIRADVCDAQLDELAAHGTGFSPIFLIPS